MPALCVVAMVFKSLIVAALSLMLRGSLRLGSRINSPGTGFNAAALMGCGASPGALNAVCMATATSLLPTCWPRAEFTGTEYVTVLG